jgi:cholesterol transport system auxiliary component
MKISVILSVAKDLAKTLFIPRLLCFAAMTMLLTSCFSPARNTRGTTYVLAEVPAVQTQAKHRAVILVLPPKTSVLYDTTKMIYTTRPYQLSYFSRHEWTAKPGEMLSPLIVETLQRTHYFKAVVTPPYLAEYEYALRTNVLMLRENFTSPTPYAEFALSAQLYFAENNQLIADQHWIARVPLTKVTPYEGARATNQAVAEVLEKLARFCTR